MRENLRLESSQLLILSQLNLGSRDWTMRALAHFSLIKMEMRHVSLFKSRLNFRETRSSESMNQGRKLTLKKGSTTYKPFLAI